MCRTPLLLSLDTPFDDVERGRAAVIPRMMVLFANGAERCHSLPGFVFRQALFRHVNPQTHDAHRRPSVAARAVGAELLAFVVAHQLLVVGARIKHSLAPEVDGSWQVGPERYEDMLVVSPSRVSHRSTAAKLR